MNFLQQRRILWWIISILLVFNISAGITILYHIYGSTSNLQEEIQTDFLQTELNLDAGQMHGLGRIRAQYRQVGEPVASAIRQVRSEIADEMTKSHPDTNRIKQLADHMGTLQGELTYRMATQYLGIKKFCNPDQAKKLNSAYRYLFGAADDTMQKGRGYRYRHGQRGRGNK